MPAGDATSHLSFELVLHESTNAIDTVYDVLSGTGADGSHTAAGLEDGSATRAATYERFLPGSLHAGTTVTFTPSPQRNADVAT